MPTCADAPIYLPDIERMARSVTTPINNRNMQDRLLRAALAAEKMFGVANTVELLRGIADAIENDRTPIYRV
jgi:hypothetical protein